MAICAPPACIVRKNPSCSFGCSRTHQEEYLKIPNLSPCLTSPVSAGWLRTYNDLHCPFYRRDIVTVWLIYHTGREGYKREKQTKSLGSSIMILRLTRIKCKQPLRFQMPEKDFPSLPWSFSSFLLLFHYIRLP